MNDLMASLLTLTGGGLILWQVLDMVRAAESRNWPRAPGKVLRSFVDREEGDEGPMYLVEPGFALTLLSGLAFGLLFFVFGILALRQGG